MLRPEPLKVLRTVFAGTPEFAVPSLEALLSRQDLEIVAVYTQPDRPAGRGRQLKPSAVKSCAAALPLEIRQPVNLRDSSAFEAFAALKPDLFVVAAYGLILPRSILDVARHTINVHASLLPRWRGAAPIQRALMAGDTGTGISIMRIVEGLDAGPVWLQSECPISGNDCGGSLHDKLATLGASTLLDALDLLQGNRIHEIEQDHNIATYAHKITREHRVLDWTRSAIELQRQVRALSPVPGTLAKVGKIESKILACEVIEKSSDAVPGTIVSCSSRGVVLATGHEQLCITELQPAGKQPMSAAAFANGYGKLL